MRRRRSLLIRICPHLNRLLARRKDFYDQEKNRSNRKEVEDGLQPFPMAQNNGSICFRQLEGLVALGTGFSGTQDAHAVDEGCARAGEQSNYGREEVVDRLDQDMIR